jgi:hypothetical protein
MVQNDIADPHLYRTYWGLVLSDILFHLGYEATSANKELLHEFHKRVLGYDSMTNRTQEVLSKFITDVTIFWAVEYGIFVRTSKKQPLYIETKDLHDLWDIL